MTAVGGNHAALLELPHRRDRRVRIPGGKPGMRQGFFVVLAERDHAFFEYQPKHTSDAVC